MPPELQKALQGQLNELRQKQDADHAQLIKILRDPVLPDHSHNGFDSDSLDFSEIRRRRIWIHHTIVGTAAATAANYAVFWIAPFACTLVEFREVHQTAGSSADAALQLEKLTGTEALDSGDAMLNSAMELDATANVVRTATLTNTFANRNLARGDRLALDDAGTLTAVANVTVVAEFVLT